MRGVAGVFYIESLAERRNCYNSCVLLRASQTSLWTYRYKINHVPFVLEARVIIWSS